MQLHLFSSPGERDVRYIVDACRPYLSQQAKPQLAYLPAAAVGSNWLDYTVKAFKDLAEVVLIDVETMPQAMLESILAQAGALYISGGNTFLLNHRLHTSGAFDLIRQKARAGLPIVGFSAGSILCGPNILTSSDMNMCATSHFDGLGLTPYSFDVHYPTAEQERTERDEWLAEYHVFHENPLLLLEDGAYVRVTAHETTLMQGKGWLWEKGQIRCQLAVGVLATS